MMNNFVEAKPQNWFERHLNWTAAAMGVGSVTLFLFLAWAGFGFNFVYPFDLGNYSSLFFTLVAIGWCLLTFLGYGWVNFKKRQSRLYLLFLLPLLLTTIGFFIRELFFSPDIILGITSEIDYRKFMGLDRTPVVRNLILFFNIIVFLAAWITLISTGNKNSKSNEENVPKNHKPALYTKILSSKKHTKTTFVFTIGYTILAVIGSFLFYSYGHLTLHITDSSSQKQLDFSFSYPTHFNKPTGVIYTNPVSPGRTNAGQFFLRDSKNSTNEIWITPYLPAESGFGGLTINKLKEQIFWHDAQPAIGPVTLYFHIIPNVFDPIPVNQMVISRSSSSDWEGYTNYIYFFDSTYFWVIQYDSFRKFDPMPDDLKCIIDSFQIYSQ